MSGYGEIAAHVYAHVIYLLPKQNSQFSPALRAQGDTQFN